MLKNWLTTQYFKVLRRSLSYKYEDNKYTKWLSYSANYDKILPGFAKQYRECKNNYDIEPSEFPNPLKINFNVVVHFGTPDPRDEVNFIKDLFTTFIKIVKMKPKSLDLERKK